MLVTIKVVVDVCVGAKLHKVAATSDLTLHRTSLTPLPNLAVNLPEQSYILLMSLLHPPR
jgi:hypothetical protein